MQAVGISTAPRSMRSFLILWFGEMISLIGSGLTSFALGVWIYQKTGEATPFAMTVLISTLPRILLLPLTGMLADRWNRRLLMLLADTGSALTTLAVVFLAAGGTLDIWHIYLVSFFSAVCSAFQEPSFRASVVMLVPREDLGRANGLLSMSEAAQLLLSPLLAGLLFGSIGLSGVILIDFLTFFAALAALLIVRIPQPEVSGETAKQKASVKRDTAAAWHWLRARPGLFWTVWYFALVNFLLNLAAVLFTPLVLGYANVEALGLVQMAMGVGMLGGSLVMGAWGGPKRRMRGVVGFIVVMAIGLAICGLRPSPVAAGLGLFVMMFALPIGQGSGQAINQSKIEPGMQGRIMALRSMIAQSMMPLAFLSAGPLADSVFNPLMQPGGALADTFVAQLLGQGSGIGLIYVVSGLLLVLISALAWSNPHIRNLEEELPDVAR